jgi:DNA-binding MurR/RpiR family transcriptional regulator
VSVQERLRRAMPDLSSREARAARHLLANYPIAGLTTVAELAQQSGVSTATILRLMKRIGFPVYSDFQEALRNHIEETLQSPLLRIDQRPAGARRTTDSFFARFAESLTEHVRSMPELISEKDFNRAVALLSDPRRDIYFLGGRYSRHVAGYMADLLSAVRAKVHVIEGQTQSWPQRLLDIGRRSVLVALDVRRYQTDVVDFVEAAANRGANIILLTDIWQSPGSRSAQVVLTFPVKSPSIFDALTLGMGLAEALVGATAGKMENAGKRRIQSLEQLRAHLQNSPSPLDRRSAGRAGHRP